MVTVWPCGQGRAAVQALEKILKQAHCCPPPAPYDLQECPHHALKYTRPGISLFRVSWAIARDMWAMMLGVYLMYIVNSTIYPAYLEYSKVRHCTWYDGAGGEVSMLCVYVRCGTACAAVMLDVHVSGVYNMHCL